MSQRSTPHKPNVIFVFADQLRYSALGCSGNPIVQTPNIDRMAREGVIFDQAFSSCPLCGPYRGQLLTGVYSHVNGVVCNEYRLFDDQTTIAQVLKSEGYRTCFVGKWHLGYGPYPEEKRYGFDDLLVYNCEDHRYDLSYWHNEEGPHRMVDFAPKVETQLALDYIKSHIQRHQYQPLFLCMAWVAPHWNTDTTDRDYGEYPQQYAIYDPESIDVPGNVPKQMREFARREIADYYGNVTALDACVGRLLAALDEWGLSENTIVCFTSDHGDHLSSHGYGKPSDDWMHQALRGSKGTPYEESIHIPFVLRYPRVICGNRRTGTLLSSVDVMPTLLALCDTEVPPGVQGKDLSHTVLGTSGEEPDSVYLQILGPGFPTRVKWMGLWRGVRTHRYLYARWKDQGGKRALFDLESDPLEMHNLVGDPEYSRVVEELEQRLRRWIEETGDPFDTGRRLPATEMLDLGQEFIDPKWHLHGASRGDSVTDEVSLRGDSKRW